jgi:hypothetical protein
MMLKKKSISLTLLAVLGLPQICLAENFSTTDTLSQTTGSIELSQDNIMIADRRDRARQELRNRRREIRSDIRDRSRDRRDYRRDRRREFRDDVRDSARRARNRRTARRVVGGVAAIGIGAAIAESNRNNRQNTETVIIERGNDLEDRGYYDDLYKCEHLNQGGYYNADELERCLR